MIALTGGKTGGHIMPLIALAKQLDNPCYVGASNSLEEQLCKKHHIFFIGMSLTKNSVFQILKSSFHLKLKNVDAIISTGGYVSLPLLLYGVRHHIPIYLLEENVVMGKTNHLLSFFAKKVFLTYELPKMKKKYEVVGLPVLTKNITNKYTSLGIDILVIGGSLGSKPLCDLAEALSRKYKVCLIAGRYAGSHQASSLMTYEFVDDLPSLMSASKLVISRAGASTTYEIFSLQRPCILVPSMKTSKNHQYLNALYFEKKGCCKMLKEKDALQTAEKLIDELLSSPEQILNMRMNQKKLVVYDSVEKILNAIEGKQ